MCSFILLCLFALKVAAYSDPVRLDGCPLNENPANPTHLPVINDCTKFYKCLDGFGYVNNCPAGLWWNSANDVCDYPVNSDCGNLVGGQPQPEKPKEPMESLPDGCPVNESPVNPTLLPHPYDCTKFYKCYYGEPVVQDCPSGLWWNEDFHYCDYPINTNCEHFVSTPKPNESTTEVLTTRLEEGTTEYWTKTTTRKTTEDEGPTPDWRQTTSWDANENNDLVRNNLMFPFKCDINQDSSVTVYYPDVTNCNRFYICNHGVPLLRRCPKTLSWNQRKSECDFPENVNCAV